MAIPKIQRTPVGSSSPRPESFVDTQPVTGLPNSDQNSEQTSMLLSPAHTLRETPHSTPPYSVNTYEEQQGYSLQSGEDISPGRLYENIVDSYRSENNSPQNHMLASPTQHTRRDSLTGPLDSVSSPV